ncbi:PAS domain-containing protein [Geranomyces variabilis]|nr:PAS domain-containing protein [Geranomyces variabilis]KAJ3136671.1 blue light receptor [Geranomyces variabilis]
MQPDSRYQSDDAERERQNAQNPTATTPYGGSGLNINKLPMMEPRAINLGPTTQIPPSISLTGIYSATGFDILGILSWVVHRPNPKIHIGPVDLSCSFVVTDPRKPDNPIVYASDTFSKLTGYAESEIVGRSCRFLQSPDGEQKRGDIRRYTDHGVISQIRQKIEDGDECQYTIINYKKTGEPFINLLTVIPVELVRPGEISFFVGFQVDLVDQPQAILDRMRDGTYTISYQTDPADIRKSTAESDLAAYRQGKSMLASPLSGRSFSSLSESLISDVTEEFLDDLGDFVHIVSLRGLFLYAAPQSTKQLLEYHADELMGRNVQDFVHPADFVPMMRELRVATPGTNINIMARYRRKRSGYVYLEINGHIYEGDKSKRTKCFILTGRQKDISTLNVNDVLLPARDSLETWVKLSHGGIILYAFSNSANVLGDTPQGLASHSFSEHLPDASDQAIFHDALSRVVARETIEDVRCRITSKRGFYRVVIRLFGTGCRTLRSLYAQIKIIEQGGVDPLDLKSLADYRDMYAEGNLFDVMREVRPTSLPYEINKVRMQNKRIRDELGQLCARNSKPTSEEAVNANTCAQCHTQSSPEWRKGPGGIGRILCNACGLRYAKAQRLQTGGE